MLSFGGIAHFIRRKFDLRPEVCPVVALSVTGVILFIGGCINLLVPSAIALFILGYLCYLYDLIFESGSSVKTFIDHIKGDITVGTIVFTVFSVYLFIWLSGARIYYYDNFTHWELIVKNLIYDSKFPDAADRIIEYRSYPVGSSVFVWYVCKALGMSEGHALFGQSLLSLSCGITLFGFADKGKKANRIVSYILAFLGTVALTTCYPGLENGVNSLMVDRLIAALGVASYSIIISHKDDLKKALAASVPVLSLVTVVKSSGIFFVISCLILVVHLTRRSDKSAGGIVKSSAALISGPVLMRVIWGIRMHVVFAGSDETPHRISGEYYEQILAQKSPENIRQILKMFFTEVFTHNDMFVWMFVVMALIFIVLKVYSKGGLKIADYGFTAVFLIVNYVLYQAGNLAMYIFSMPWVEAKRLCWYARYVMTIDAFCFGVILVMTLCIIRGLDDIGLRSGLMKGVLIALSFLVLPMHLLGAGTLLVRQDLTGEEKLVDDVRKIIDIHDLPQDQNVSYFVLFSENEEWLDQIEAPVGFRYYFCKTMFYSADITVTSLNRLNELEGQDLTGYDYYIFISPEGTDKTWRDREEFTSFDPEFIEYSYSS